MKTLDELIEKFRLNNYKIGPVTDNKDDAGHYGKIIHKEILYGEKLQQKGADCSDGDLKTRRIDDKKNNRNLDICSLKGSYDEKYIREFAQEKVKNFIHVYYVIKKEMYPTILDDNPNYFSTIVVEKIIKYTNMNTNLFQDNLNIRWNKSKGQWEVKILSESKVDKIWRNKQVIDLTN